MYACELHMARGKQAILDVTPLLTVSLFLCAPIYELPEASSPLDDVVHLLEGRPGSSF